MAGNTLKWSQGLLQIVADTSVDDAAETPSEVWSLPPTTIKSYLTLALETVAGTGRTAIRVTNAGALPGTADTIWVLEYLGYQGAAPVPLIWNQITLATNQVNNLIEEPLPSALYRFRLVARSGSPSYFTEATINTPADSDYTALTGIFNDDILSRAEKSTVITTVDGIIQEQTGLDAIATLWQITTEKTNYDTAITNLTSALTALSPAWNLLTADTPLGVGGGASLRTKFSTVASTRSILKQQIDTLSKSSIDDMGADGILSKGEKLSIIIRFNVAVADTSALTNKAKALGIPYSSLTAAFGSLQSYLRALDAGTYDAYITAGGLANEAHLNTRVDTSIAPATWSSTWNTFDVARAKLTVSLQGANHTISVAMGFTGATGQVGRNVNIGATGVTSFDGYTVVNGDTLLAGNQTTYSQNGIYSVAVTGGGVGAAKTYASVGTLQGAGTYTNDSYSRDNNTLTYGDLVAPGTIDDPTCDASVIYSGWSGAQTGGTLTVNTYWVITDNGNAHGTGNIYYSTDGGASWILFTNGSFSTAYLGAHTVTVALTGVNQSMLRIKVDALSGTRSVRSGLPPDYTWNFFHGSSEAQINEVYFDATAVGGGSVSLTKLAEIADGEIYLIANGTNWGGKSLTINRPTLNGEVTFSSALPAYQLPLAASYSGGTAVVLGNTAGVLSWVSPAGTVGPQGATGSTGATGATGVTGATGTTAYDISCSISGKPTASQKVMILVAPRSFTISATGHKAKVYINATATAGFVCAKNGTTFGTLSISPSGILTLSGFTSTTFNVDDILTITAPASQDTTLADIGLILYGTC